MTNNRNISKWKVA